MQVFKVSMKVIQKNIPSLLIYLIIFLGLSVLFASNASDQQQEYASFDVVKNNVAVFLEEETPLILGFLENLQETSTIIEIEDNKDAIADALYFRVVTYVIRVPKGFTQAFMENKSMQLEKQSVPESTTNTYTQLAIDSYFNTARLFLIADKDIDQQRLADKTNQVLKNKTKVTIENIKQRTPDSYARFFFNYMSYSLVSILILGTSLVMLVWKNKDIADRTEVSPLSKRSLFFQKYAALSVFALLTWGILFGSYFVISKKGWDNFLTLYMVNSLVFTYTSLALSFLVGTLITSKNALSGVSNVLSLGPSFISGVFVPQELLGASVLAIAKITPTYWFVTSNNLIASLSSFTLNSLKPIAMNVLIVMAFGIVFIALALYVNKGNRGINLKKNLSNQS